MSEKTLLLHCCCAPCTLMPLDALRSAGWQPLLYFYNPNIHPYSEYEHRLSVLRSYLDKEGLQVQAGSYDAELWEATVGIYGGPYPLLAHTEEYAEMLAAKRQRCRACYDLRFRAAADFAKTQACTSIDTTLTISPYQFTAEICDSIATAAKAYGLAPLNSNWRDFYPQSVQRSRALGLYRQNFCGCRYSLQEAQIERAARKSSKNSEAGQRSSYPIQEKLEPQGAN